MPGDPWIDDSEWGGPPRPAPSPPPLQATQAMVPAVKCPECGSHDVFCRDNGKVATMLRWECRTCPATAFKLPASLRVVRGYIIVSS